MKTIFTFYATLPILVLFAIPGAAQIYQCKMDDGSIKFSDSACPEAKESVTIKKHHNKAELAPEVCETAQRFAKALTGMMRQGQSSMDAINELGGSSVVAPGVKSLINQVFSYRHNPSIDPARAGYLIMTRCNNRAFGDIKVEDFPQAYRPRPEYDANLFPGNWPNQNFNRMPNERFIDQAPQIQEQQRPFNRQQKQQWQQESERRQQLKQQKTCGKYKDRLARLREQMRDGYSLNSAERLRKEEKTIQQNIRKHCGR